MGVKLFFVRAVTQFNQNGATTKNNLLFIISKKRKLICFVVSTIRTTKHIYIYQESVPPV